MNGFRRVKHKARAYAALSILTLLSLLLPTSGALGSPNGFITSNIMTIMGKTGNAVIISERHFTVSGSTLIVDEKGKRIALSDLPVPCTAKIRYQLQMDGNPLCLSIQIKKLKKDSRQDWSSSDQEAGQ